MTKRIIATLLLVCMAITLLAACSDALDTEKAKQIALKDMGITEDQASAIDAHLTEYEGAASYSIYITYNGQQTEYIIHGKTGEILHKGPSTHSHSH